MLAYIIWNMTAEDFQSHTFPASMFDGGHGFCKRRDELLLLSLMDAGVDMETAEAG